MAKEQIPHTDPEDLRIKTWTSKIGRHAVSQKAVQAPLPPGEQGSSGSIRFALAWEDYMLDYPDEDLVFTPGANCNGNTKHPKILPGSAYVWFERIFSHPIQGVVLTGSDYEFVFNQTEQTNINSIYNQNGCTIDVDGTQETWNTEYDNFRPGTPFTVTGTDDNDGFYRVKSRREEGSRVYIIVDNNNYEQQELVSQGSDGTAECDFGGDWYQIVSHEGNSVGGNNTAGGDMTAYLDTLGDSVYNTGINKNWWTEKDSYHRYEGNVFGPNDGRPPTGGQLSKDFNGNWIRTANPNLYHHYDENAHRWIIRAETDGSQPPAPGGTYEQFTSITPSYEFLSFQADPKEIISPFRFDDTETTAWKYGSKVQLKALQLTDPSGSGAINNVIRTGTEAGATYSGHSSHSQYTTIYSVDGNVEIGDWPDIGDQNPKPIWINDKYNKALQNAVERIVSSGNWALEVDDTYIENWLNLFKHLPVALEDTSSWDPYDVGTPYSEDDEVKVSSQVYVSLQNGNEGIALDNPDWWRKFTVGEAEAHTPGSGWAPDINLQQNEVVLIDDELWGENGSGLELLLKKTGSFDWYYDETYVFQSKRTLDDAWEWASFFVEQINNSFPQTHNGVVCNSAVDIMNAWWHKPAGCWRRTWKYSLGKPQGDDTVMRSTEPTFQSYASNGANYPYNVLGNHDNDYVNDPGLYGLWEGVMDDILMFGHLVMASPTETTDEADIEERHQKTYTVNDHKIYTENVKQIICDCENVLNKLTTFTSSLGLVFLNKQENPQGDLTTDWEDAKSTFITDVAAQTPDLEDLSDSGTIVNAQIQQISSVDSIARYGVSGTWQYNGLSITLSKADSLKYEETSDEFIMRVLFSAKTTNAHYDDAGDLFVFDPPTENRETQNPGWKGIVPLVCLSDFVNYYKLSEIKASDAEITTWDAATERYTFKYTLEHAEEPYFSPINQPINRFNNASQFAVAQMNIISSAPIYSTPNFEYPEIIFTRSYERADYKLIDPDP